MATEPSCSMCSHSLLLNAISISMSNPADDPRLEYRHLWHNRLPGAKTPNTITVPEWRIYSRNAVITLARFCRCADADGVWLALQMLFCTVGPLQCFTEAWRRRYRCAFSLLTFIEARRPPVIVVQPIWPLRDAPLHLADRHPRMPLQLLYRLFRPGAASAGIPISAVPPHFWEADRE